MHLQTVFQGQVIGAMLLTHIKPEHGKEAYGLIDFGNGVARMSIVFLDQLKTWYPRYDYKIEVQQDFEAPHPISVYKKASEDICGLIVTNRAALQWAATQIEITKARDEFITPTRPAFLNFRENWRHKFQH